MVLVPLGPRSSQPCPPRYDANFGFAARGIIAGEYGVAAAASPCARPGSGGGLRALLGGRRLLLLLRRRCGRLWPALERLEAAADEFVGAGALVAHEDHRHLAGAAVIAGDIDRLRRADRGHHLALGHVEPDRTRDRRTGHRRRD